MWLTKTWQWTRWVLTDANDQWDIPTLLALYAIVLFLYKATVAPPPFDFMNFGAGAAGVFGAGKMLEWFTHRKDKTERDDDARVQHDSSN